MVVNINCQLDGIYNHLGDKSLGMSGSDQSDEDNGIKRTYSSCKLTPFHGLQSQLHIKEKLTQAQTFIALSSLTADVT